MVLASRLRYQLLQLAPRGLWYCGPKEALAVAFGAKCIRRMGLYPIRSCQRSPFSLGRSYWGLSRQRLLLLVAVAAVVLQSRWLEV